MDEEISLGDFVLTGGEIAAMAVADSVCRLVPGVLADEQCYIGESHWDGLLEYPQYTRPEIWEGRTVPEVLLQGDHAKVARWRRKKQLERTRDKRPDLFEKLELTDAEDRKLLSEIRKEAGRRKLDNEVTCRRAEPEDIADILRIVEDAKALLKKHRVDQWQGEYPTEQIFRADIAREECFVVCHGDEVAAFFVLSTAEEESYNGITDGKWTEGLSCCVLHRAAVSAAYRGSGLSEQMLRFVEQQCRAYGLRCIRTDTHKKNKAMQGLLRENGYRYRGNLVISCEPGHETARQAYEKILKDKK